MSNKLLFTLTGIFLALFLAIVLSLDNSERPTPADDDLAYAEWNDMDTPTQAFVCRTFNSVNDKDIIRRAMMDEGDSEGFAEAQIDLLERECA